MTAATSPDPVPVTVYTLDYMFENMEAYQAIVGKGSGIEIDTDLYWHFLQCTPPISKTLKRYGRELFGGFEYAEGTERVTTFWMEASSEGTTRYYCQQSDRVNTG